MNSSGPKWKDFLGFKLEEISGLFLQGAEADIQNPIAVGLVLSGSSVKIRSGDKGEGLSIETLPLRSVEMGDQGALMVRDLSNDPIFCLLIGSDLKSIESVQGLNYRDDLGAMLKFSAGELWICNIGDELHIDRRIPASLIGDVELTPIAR